MPATLNTSRVRALEVMDRADLTEDTRATLGIQERTLDALRQKGMAKLRFTGDSQVWSITNNGRYALMERKKPRKQKGRRP